MNKELEIWQFAARRLKRDEAVMLLVVAESAGSSPGRQGFKMIVAGDEMTGSIGGGVMEIKLVEAAKTRLFPAEGRRRAADAQRKARVVEQVHQKNSPNASGMICSGKQKIIFFKLGAEDLPVVRRVIQHLKNKRERYLRITGGGFDVVRHQKSDFDFNYAEDESGFLYEEKLGFKHRLFIVGGGHCALALSEIMAKMDFHISLFDDREDLNTLAKNDFVEEKKIVSSYEQIGDFIPPGPNNYVVVMTLGYKFDEIVIRKLFDQDFKYFGVLGSRAKMKTLLRSLEKEGFDRERLARIRTPIGLKINSRTPEEIAVSIAAEIIQVKNSI
jgi:xanthine dehydrogenase accessory factor